MNRNELFLNIFELISMVVKTILFEFIQYVGIQIYIGHIDTIFWSCYLS